MRTRVLAPLVAVLSYGLGPSISTCVAGPEPLYAKHDATGRLVYSNRKPTTDATPLALPLIERVAAAHPDGTPQERKDPTCETRGGVSCEQGSDSDGSVICVDGYRDALTRFKEFCQTAKLLPLGIPSRWEDSPRTIVISIQNASAAVARAVLAEFVVNKFDPPLRFSGPAHIEPYSISDYRLSVDEETIPHYRKLSATDIRVSCENCR